MLGGAPAPEGRDELSAQPSAKPHARSRSAIARGVRTGIKLPVSGESREGAQREIRLHIEAKSGLKAFLDKKPVPWVK